MTEVPNPKGALIGRVGSVAAASSDPHRVIARALLDARRRGLDDVSQTRCAVAAVQLVRPDLSRYDIAHTVEGVRRQVAWSAMERLFG